MEFNPETFELALERFIAYAQKVSDEHMEKTFPTNLRPRIMAREHRTRSGIQKFVHIDSHAHQTMSHAVVRISDGAILYPAAYSRPFIAKGDKGKPDAQQSPATVRGNIYDESTWAKCVGPYGVRTIR